MATAFDQLASRCRECLTLGCRDCAGRFYHQIALHFLMESGAEIRAIKRKHAGLAQLDPDRFCFTRVDRDVDVIFHNAETVNHVASLFDIGQINRERVADLCVDPVRNEAAADGGQFGHDFVAIAR